MRAPTLVNGRRIERASRRVAANETLMVLAVDDQMHERLTGLAVRRGLTVDRFVKDRRQWLRTPATCGDRT